MKNPIPESALPNHIGFLGITGSGKTSGAIISGRGSYTANPDLF